MKDRHAPERAARGQRDAEPRAGAAGEFAATASRLAELMPLDAPVVFLDLEATGLDTCRDRVVEICCVRVDRAGEVTTLDTLVDPGVEIPAEATAVHGIEAAHVAGAPRFADIVDGFLALIDGAALAGYNLGRYDLPLLAAEADRAGRSFVWREHRILDVSVIFRRMEPRSLAGAVRFYCGEEHTGAHTAAGDVRATMAVLAGQLRRYPELPRDLGELDTFTRPREPEAD